MGYVRRGQVEREGQGAEREWEKQARRREKRARMQAGERMHVASRPSKLVCRAARAGALEQVCGGGGGCDRVSSPEESTSRLWNRTVRKLSRSPLSMYSLASTLSRGSSTFPIESLLRIASSFKLFSLPRSRAVSATKLSSSTATVTARVGVAGGESVSVCQAESVNVQPAAGSVLPARCRAQGCACRARHEASFCLGRQRAAAPCPKHLCPDGDDTARSKGRGRGLEAG